MDPIIHLSSSLNLLLITHRPRNRGIIPISLLIFGKHGTKRAAHDSFCFESLHKRECETARTENADLYCGCSKYGFNLVICKRRLVEMVAATSFPYLGTFPWEESLITRLYYLVSMQWVQTAASGYSFWLGSLSEVRSTAVGFRRKAHWQFQVS